MYHRLSCIKMQQGMGVLQNIAEKNTLDEVIRREEFGWKTGFGWHRVEVCKSAWERHCYSTGHSTVVAAAADDDNNGGGGDKVSSSATASAGGLS